MTTTQADSLALEARLRAAEARRDALDDAIHVIAHDLRGQLGAVLGYADLLERRLDGTDETAREYADTIAGVSERLAQQIDRMLAVFGASRRTIRPERVDASALVRDVVDELQVGSDRPLAPVQVAEGIVVHADPALLRIVLEALVSNALKAARPGDPTPVEVTSADLGDGQIEIAVRDHGIGFDPGQAHRLFTPSGRLHDDASFPGVGLGLASVARIVESHGGRVAATSDPSTGTVFSVTLPGPDGA